jgi:hypothetical protein
MTFFEYLIEFGIERDCVHLAPTSKSEKKKDQGCRIEKVKCSHWIGGTSV